MPDQLRAQLERDLLDQRVSGLAGDLWEKLPNLSEDEFGQLDQDVEDAKDEEDPEFTDEEKARQLAKYRSELADERADLAYARKQIRDLQPKLGDAKTVAARALPQLEANLRNAEAALARVESGVKNLPTARTVTAAERDLAEAKRAVLEAEAALDLPDNVGRQVHLRNLLGAARARQTVAEMALQNAEDAHQKAATDLRDYAEAGVKSANYAIRENNAPVKGLESRLSTQEFSASQAQSRISELNSLIRALESQNQLAGPSGDAFETLRARGVEFWSRGSIAFADDTQSGRNQEIEQREITAGVHGRFSERLLMGLAVSYVNGDNDDQTGAGISTDTDTFMIAPYVAYQVSEDLALDASGLYGFTDVSLTRATAATASYDSTTLGAQIGLSLRHRLSKVISLTGRVGQSYVTTDSDGYTDTAGTSVASSDSEQAATSLSGRINVSTDPDWRWHGALKMRYDTIDPGNGVDRFYGNLSTGLEYNPGSYAIAVQASRSVFRSNYEATGLSLQIRVPF